MKFEDISTPLELKEYLIERVNQQKDSHNEETHYVYHYTKVSAAIAILNSRKWYLGSPLNMNDGLEAGHIKQSEVDNLFFASFMVQDRENIGMWGMYSQPWEEGIIIRIPIKEFKAWIKDNPTVYDADAETKEAQSQIKPTAVFQHFVAYTDEESKGATKEERTTYGFQMNTKLSGLLKESSLAGFLKDSAWSYEKELRLRVETDENEKHDAVSIDIPQDVVNSMEFITGPRFSGNLLAMIRKDVDSMFDAARIKPSLFTGRMKWVYCDSCAYKNAKKKEKK